MNLRDLKYLVAVSQYNHFGKAARACFVSQPTLSTQLRKLEDELGVQLFERNNKRVMITSFGKEIIQHAENILREVTYLKQKAKLVSDPLAGTFKLGIIPTVCPYLLPKIMPLLKQNLPKLELLLLEEKTDKLTELLNKGAIDAAILALPLDNAQFNHTPLYQEPFYLALPNDHKLSVASEHLVSIEQLKGELLLLLEDGHCLTNQVLEICNYVDTQEKIDFRATSLETLRLMVAQGSGVTLLPALSIDPALHKNTGLFIRGFCQPVPKRSIALFWRKQSTSQIICKKFELIIHQWVKDLTLLEPA